MRPNMNLGGMWAHPFYQLNWEWTQRIDQQPTRVIQDVCDQVGIMQLSGDLNSCGQPQGDTERSALMWPTSALSLSVWRSRVLDVTPQLAQTATALLEQARQAELGRWERSRQSDRAFQAPDALSETWRPDESGWVFRQQQDFLHGLLPLELTQSTDRLHLASLLCTWLQRNNRATLELLVLLGGSPAARAEVVRAQLNMHLRFRDNHAPSRSALELSAHLLGEDQLQRWPELSAELAAGIRTTGERKMLTADFTSSARTLIARALLPELGETALDLQVALGTIRAAAEQLPSPGARELAKATALCSAPRALRNEIARRMDEVSSALMGPRKSSAADKLLDALREEGAAPREDLAREDLARKNIGTEQRVKDTIDQLIAHKAMPVLQASGLRAWNLGSEHRRSLLARLALVQPGAARALEQIARSLDLHRGKAAKQLIDEVEEALATQAHQ